MQTTSDTQRAFVRALPGGGFVAIDLVVDRSVLRHPDYRGVLIVERRVNGNRDTLPPVIARAAGPSADAVVRQLLPTAQSNSAIGEALVFRTRRGVLRGAGA